MSNLRSTRHLDQKPKSEPMPPRQTDQLDLSLPVSLRLVLNDSAGVIDVALRNYLVIGRRDNGDDRQVDIDFSPYDGQHLGVSRYHAIIQISNNRLGIKDINSTNGTFLNGYTLQPMFGYRLRHGDELTLGRLKMSVQFVDRK
jgi:pSer/pThr/pTyr-binding forkhead associated (FHA) protein